MTEQTPLRVRQREQTVKGLRFDSKGVYVHALQGAYADLARYSLILGTTAS